MDIKDILAVGLTAEDFDALVEGIDAIPEKGFGMELMMSIITTVSAAGSTPKHQEQAKQQAVSRLRDSQKKADSRKDDLIILKSKLILLKRLLMSNEAVKAANDILNHPPPHINANR